MEVEDASEPPKKKLKQAKLSFCFTSPRNKRKLSEPLSEDGKALKIVCKDNDRVTDENVVKNHDVKSDSENKNPNGEHADKTELGVIYIDDSNDHEENNKENGDSHEKSTSEGNGFQLRLSFEQEKSDDVDSSNGEHPVKTELDAIYIDDSNDHEENNKENGDSHEKSTSEGNSFQLHLSLHEKSDDVDSNGEHSQQANNINRTQDSENCKVEDSNEKETDNAGIEGEKLGCVELNENNDALNDSTLVDVNNESFNVTGNETFEMSDSGTSPISESDKANFSNQKKIISPKQRLLLEKKKEKERLKEERAKQREEKLRKKMEEEDLKRRKKEEKLKKREEEQRLKEEDRKMKDEEKKKKVDEKKRKEEAKEEEKRKKKEAKLVEEQKKAQAQLAFSSFFIPKKSKCDNEQVEKSEEVEPSSKFMPFSIKPDMRLAGERRAPLSPNTKRKLDEIIAYDKMADKSQLYLSKLKNGYVPSTTQPTWHLSDEQHDVIIIESDVIENEAVVEDHSGKNKFKMHKAKLFQFHDNRRPPYWGTWRKKSTVIKPRNPLNKDKNMDYEVDSDSEWEDEGEGEDIGNEDADSDKEPSDDENVGENGYVLDNIFVPHGYLSDEEAADEEIFTPEDQKLRMQVLKKEFDEEMKTKTERLKPRLLGCVWISNETTEVSKGSLYTSLLNHRAVWDEEKGSIDVSVSEGVEIPSSPQSTSKTKKFPQEVLDLLVKFVHGNNLPLSKLLLEFTSKIEKDLPTVYVSKNALTRKVREIASKSRDFNKSPCWVVNTELQAKYGLQSVDIVPENQTPPAGKSIFSYLKNNPSSSKTPRVRKRAALTTIKDPEDTLKGQEKIDPATPVIKKKIPFVTITRTPDFIGKPPVHVDTPRPVHPFFKVSQEKGLSSKASQPIAIAETSDKEE